MTIDTITKEANELSTQILTEDTSLIFQWIPRSYGLSVPNNKDYPYLQRLVSWAEREPQRKIYLVVDGAGLEQNQIAKLREDLKPASGIHIVDYQQVSKEAGFEHFKIYTNKNGILNLSDLLEQRYDKSAAKYLNFPNIIDAMRLEMLYNIEKITSCKDAIYFDFDILPKGNQQIGPVSIPKGILLASYEKELENSIIGVNNKSPDIIMKMWNYAQFRLIFEPRCTDNVYAATKEIVRLSYFQENDKLSIDELLKNQQDLIVNNYEHRLTEDEVNENLKAISILHSKFHGPFAIEWHHEKWYNGEWYDKFNFEKNLGNAEVKSDNSWMKSLLYSDEDLPLCFSNTQDQPITASSLPYLPMHLNNVDTESTIASDNHTEILKEIIESSLSKEPYEDLYKKITVEPTYEDYFNGP